MLGRLPNAHEAIMHPEHHVRLMRSRGDQVLRIPRELELPGNEAVLRKEGERLIVEVAKRPRLLAVLATLEPLDEDFPTIEDPPPESIEL